MSTAEFQKVQGDAISVTTTSYATAVSDPIESGHADNMGVSIQYDTGAGTSAIKFKLQVYDHVQGGWVDLYRNNAGALEIEAYTLSVSASQSDIDFATVLSTLGVRQFRLAFQSVGGTATIDKINVSVGKPNIYG